MKKLWKLTVVIFAVALFAAATMHVSYQLGMIAGHRQALEYLQNDAPLPLSSPIRAAWESYEE